ncbi:NADH dehydrogenase [ubiquinone] 1 beta subcomplex subunit 3 [Colletes gigas]|uniref:NADH dehydrogenase [ubiquinone] 1 beta subcomplex subunit 3 n=1 Tax=Colletes gigas TaxID=935657 RepID=UPI001C9A4156|nr:NADH dehydrogenase [ubiquinone] 1 beta subcomplex subunit 3 [Colletes gigas]
MGGHGHALPKVPSPDAFKVEDVPRLLRVQQKLAEKGLKDPWLRNEVWRFHSLEPSFFKQIVNGLLRGWKLGIPAFLLTIAAEQYLGNDHSNGHHEEHHSDGHH